MSRARKTRASANQTGPVVRRPRRGLFTRVRTRMAYRDTWTMAISATSTIASPGMFG